MKKSILLLTAAVLVLTGCKQKQDAENIIGKPVVNVENGRFTPEVMWGLGKMGEYDRSPADRVAAL